MMQPALKCPLRLFCTHNKGPPVRVAFTKEAGRGVFATRNIREGELIHTAEPLITHPSLQMLAKVCSLCLKHLENRVTPRSTSGHVDFVRRDACDGLCSKFCSEKCLVSAEKFSTLEENATWKSFYQFCSDEGLRMPLLAKRFVCMVVSGLVSKDAIDILSFVKPPQIIVSCWMHTHAMLIEALKDSGLSEVQLAFISDEWFYGVLARLSVNSFRIELLAKDNSNLLMSAVASISGDAICGSAVYILPSMYNHDCEPNVDITWPTNSTAYLTARRDVKEGEELRITYIDSSMSRHSRQELLQHNYQFVCNCSRCREEE